MIEAVEPVAAAWSPATWILVGAAYVLVGVQAARFLLRRCPDKIRDDLVGQGPLLIMAVLFWPMLPVFFVFYVIGRGLLWLIRFKLDT